MALRDYSHIRPAVHVAAAPARFRDPRRITVTVVLALVGATTALSMYDLYLFLTLILK